MQTSDGSTFSKLAFTTKNVSRDLDQSMLAIKNLTLALLLTNDCGADHTQFC